METNNFPEFQIDSIKASRFNKIAKNIKQDFKDDDDISFELIIGSCFPTCYANIKETIMKYYIAGYNDALKEKQNENN